MLTAALLLCAYRPQIRILLLDRKAMTPAETVLAQTIQGLVRPGGPQVWISTPGIQERLLDEIRAEGGHVQKIASPWELVDRFRSDFAGAIVYKLGTESLNVASGLAGPLDSVAIDERLIPVAKKHGLRIVRDVRGMTEAEAYRQNRSRYAPGYVVEQPVAKYGYLRDFATRHSSFVFSTDNSAFRKRVIADKARGGFAVGWGPDEFGWVRDVSLGGATTMPADWCANLSVLETLPTGPIAPKPWPPVQDQPGERYVAFVLSDGDNVQWQTGEFATSDRFYGSPLRGKFPFTWEVSTLLGKYGPRVLRYLYRNATPNDDFVAGSGMPGYSYAHFLGARDLAVKASKGLMHASGLRIASFLNANEGSMAETAPWLDQPEIDAAIYKTYSPYDGLKGAIQWRHGKPCVAYRFVLWEGLMDVAQLDLAISKMSTEPKNPDRYALINVHAWSFEKSGGPLAAVEKAIQGLPPHTRVVTASQLLDLVKRNRAGQ